MARPFSAALLASLLLPLASAGSPEDPEISDPAGDAEIPVSTTAGAQDALDLTAVWLAEDGDRLLLQWQVVALAESGPLDRFEYALSFESPVGPAHVEAWRQLGDSIQGAGLWVGDEMPCAHTSFDGAQPATLAFDAAASTVSLDLPKSCLLGNAT